MRLVRPTTRRWQYRVFILGTIAAALLLAGRLFQLQVLMGDYYRKLSSRNHIRVVTRPAPRGLVLDRHGTVLADNEPAFMVTVISSELDSTRMGLLAELTGLDPPELEELMEDAEAMPHRPFVLRDGLDVEEVSPVADNLYRLPGVLVDLAPLRRYRLPMAMSHVIGYVGLSEDEELRGQVTGRTGLEMTLDERLRGAPGIRREVVDAHGRIVEEFEGQEADMPIPGDTVVLNLDASLQAIAVEELLETGQPGAAVVLDWSTGELLCLASAPTYDANMFAGGISTTQWEALLEDEGKPLFCRAWAATYPPGSVYKVVTAAWLLSRGYVDRDYMPDPCYGSYHLGGNDFGCWTTHGRLDVVDAISRSCDVFFYRTCQLGTLDGLAEFTEDFGFGSRTSELLAGERSGLVPTSAYMDSIYGSDGWGLGNLLNISIGQGELLATPLQMAVSAGVVASSGSMPGVRLLREEERRGRVLPAGAVDGETFETVREGMRLAVTDRRGTLHAPFSGSPLEFYGKTGTSECAGEDHALVIGFLEEPMPLAMCVVVEHGGHGGAVAGPVARSILERYLLPTVEGD